MTETIPVNILIVDDKPENLLALAGLLDSPEINIIKATSGNEALALVLEFDMALILLDVQMPEMDGFETAELLRQNKKTRHLPIIFVTAINKNRKHVFKGYHIGAVDYLFKPLEPTILLGKVKVFIEAYRQKKALEETKDKLYHTINELKSVHNHLEERAEERTIELKKVNEQLQQEIEKHKCSEEELKKSRNDLEQAVNELKNTQAQMLQSEKMVSIGQLAAGVAHEINNPTAFVCSNLNTLSEYQNDISRLLGEYKKFLSEMKAIVENNNSLTAIKEKLISIEAYEKDVDIDFTLNDIPVMLKETKDGTARIKKIVADLKDFSHPGENEAKHANINQCLDSTLNIVWNEIKYKATVVKDYGDLPEVICYYQQLNQVFVNLLVNAAQAIEEKGEIKLTTRVIDEEIEIIIADTGQGISEEHLSRIFDPFFTTKEIGKGTGLGLNVADNIIQKHMGTIQANSKIGEGTSFIIHLPIEPGFKTNEDQ